MKWTANKPDRTGWYWWRSGAPRIQLICYIEIGETDGCVSFAYGERYRQLSEMSGQWAGPIPMPEEP